MHGAVSNVLSQVRKIWSQPGLRKPAILLVLAGTAYYLWATKPGAEDYRIIREPKIASAAIEENVQKDVYSYSLTSQKLSSSQWGLSERERFKALLSGRQFDVIVIPFQVQGSAFDRSTRSYMSAYLAHEIRRHSGLNVADPYIVARALGDGQRRISTLSIYELARAVSAKLIIWGHVGTSGWKDVKLTFQFKEKSTDAPIDAVTPAKVYSPAELRYADDRHPVEVYPAAVAEFLPHLPIPIREHAVAAREPDSDAPMLARNPTAIAGNDAGPLQAVYDFHLLAALTPKYADRVRERFAEKSMLALQTISDAVEEHRVLKARTLMLFGLRPAALRALGEPQSIEEKYYFEYLHGNLPAASEAAARLASPQQGLIASLEIAEMAFNYGAQTQAQIEARIAALDLPSPDWELLVNRAMSDFDTWIQFDNLEFKQLLNAWFPLDGPGIESLVDGAIAMGDVGRARAQVDFSVHDHVRRLDRSNSERFCCASDSARPSELDLVDLVEAMAIGNLARRVALRTDYQGLPERALSDLAGLELMYREHPLFTMLRAKAEYDASKEAQGVVQRKLRNSAHRNARNAYYWSHGQTHVAAACREILAWLARDGYDSIQDVYGRDFPFRVFYARFDGAGYFASTHFAHYALANSAIHSYPVRQLRDAFRFDKVTGERKLNKLLGAIEGRFDGSMEVALIRTEAALDRGDHSAAEAGYRQILAATPRQWEPYGGLATLLFEDGRINDAAMVALSYPGFAPDSDMDPVALSNHAYGIGSRFYWAGYFVEARSLYKIAADLRTGSHATISSTSRLDLLDENLMAALRGTYQRAIRYNSSHAYRDYLGMLHAMGQSEDAWNTFNILVQEVQEPHPWETALVGHRISATTEADLIAWSKQDLLKQKGGYGNYAANYLLRATVMDRLPSPEVIQAIMDIDEPVWQVGRFTYRKVSPGPGAQPDYVVVGPSSHDADINIPRLPATDDAAKTRVTSDLTYFAKGYRALRENDYDLAERHFSDASRLYGLRGPSYGYMLPYMAFAASKSGNTRRTLEIMERVESTETDFDYLLARAVMAALSGQLEPAVQLLRQARHRRPYTETRPVFTEYQYGEITEWLYEETGASEFREIALEWARLCQRNQPWHAWPYAMEATLSDDSPARRRAIAIAHYLDPLSERIGTLPESTIESATSQFGRLIPFRKNFKEATDEQRVEAIPVGSQEEVTG